MLLLPRDAGAARTAGLLRLRQTMQLNMRGESQDRDMMQFHDINGRAIPITYMPIPELKAATINPASINL